MTSIAAIHHTAKYNNHSRSESSTFQGTANSVTSTLIDSQNNSCFSDSCNNNPDDSSEDYDTPKTEASAAAANYKQRLSPLLSSEEKCNPESASHSLSSYTPPEINSPSKNCDNIVDVPDAEKAYINNASKSLDSNHSQFQPVSSNCSTSSSSQGSHLHRSLHVAVDSSHVVREDSIQLELPENSWSYSCHKDNQSCPTTSLSRSKGETDYSSEIDVIENRPKSKYVTHL